MTTPSSTEKAKVVIVIVNETGKTVDTLEKINSGMVYTIYEAYDDVKAYGYEAEAGVSGAGTGSSGAKAGETYYFKAPL